LVMVLVLSSAARIPRPWATMPRAVCISSLAFIVPSSGSDGRLLEGIRPFLKVRTPPVVFVKTSPE
jgi:hypothetical protein